MGVFLSTPSARRATPEWRGMLRSGCNFYPRPPRGGRRRGVWLFSTCPHISIHALREEGDVCAIYDISELISFLSTPSARRATCCGPRGGDSGCYFYPRPPRGGRLNTYEQRLAATGFLSTPSARRATATATSLGYSVEISIHALREEGDCTAQMIDPELVQFLSTPSARRATSSPASSALGLRNFYPRPPRGGRLDSVYVLLSRCIFLSTPSARRATPLVSAFFHKQLFLSTPSARRATPRATYMGTTFKISIHALREEGDEIPRNLMNRGHNFYPRPPRGGRHWPSKTLASRRLFLSTPSARRATDNVDNRCPAENKFLSTPSARRATLCFHKSRLCSLISIHALREEGDVTGHNVLGADSLFLSTPSARRATDACQNWCYPWAISIHALREEGDAQPSYQ